MINRAFIGVLFAGVTIASAQSLSLRTISRTTDVLRTQQIDAFAWYAGEPIVYELFPRIGDSDFVAPSNTVPVWFVTDRLATNYYVMVTGRVVGVTNGPIRFELTSSKSALPPARTYESYAVIYGGDPTNGATRVVIDRAQVRVERNASYDGIYVGPIAPTNVYPLDAATPVLPTFWAANATSLRNALGIDDATDLWQRVYSVETFTSTSIAAEVSARSSAFAAMSNAISEARDDFVASYSNLNASFVGEVSQREEEDESIRAELRGVVISNAIAVRTSGGWHSPEYVGGLDWEPIPRGVPASNQVVELAPGALFVRNFSDYAAIDYQLYAVDMRNHTNALVMWVVSPTSLATIGTNGFVTSLNSGTITATVQVGSFARSVRVDADVNGYAEIDWQVPGATGYWRRVIVTSIYARVSNATDNAVWHTFDPSNRVYQYASTGMMAGVDLSAFGVDTSFWFYRDWNAKHRAKRPGGALITPLHYLTTLHNELHAGDTVRLIAPDNTLVERTVIDTRFVLIPAISPDLSVALLDAPVTNIAPVRVLDKGYVSYISDISPRGANGPRIDGNPDPLPGVYLPTLWYGQYGAINLLMWGAGKRQAAPIEPWLRAWYRQPVVGDSGSPVFLLHGSEPILLGLMTSNDGTPGGLIGIYHDAVNAAIADLCGDCGYQLNLYDDFTSYIPQGAPPPPP